MLKPSRIKNSALHKIFTSKLVRRRKPNQSEIFGAAMANVNPADFVDGNVVNFREKDTLDRYEGKVCYFEPETSRFGIQAVTWIVGDERLYIGGAYINRIQYIEDLVVLQVAEPHSGSQAGQNGTNGTSAHASVNQAAGSSSTNAQAGQNGNGASGDGTSGSSSSHTQAGQNGANGA